MQPALNTSPSGGLPAAAMRKKARDAMVSGNDMTPEDWRGLVGGLLEFFAEEAEEPEHAEAEDAEAGTAEGKHAAGIVFSDPDGKVLLLKRSPSEGNFAGHWSLPGGGVEPGETPEEGARREANEEIGDHPEGELSPIKQKTTPTGMTFHTFRQPVDEQFEPTLNDEHTAHVWAHPSDLPEPMHPAVAELMAGLTGDAAATDSALKLALDRDSVREFDKDGRMRVKVANISKANVCPYRGEEIPGWRELGLEKDRVYRLLRDPEELERAAPTFNGIQLLRKHKPVNADDHRKHDIVGTTGSDAKFDGPYLTNSLFVWTKEGIDLIESDLQKQLSSGYHYKPVMVPGTYQGTPYDGRMTEIVGNHVALVEDGRAGDDVVVGDSDPFAAQWRIVERAILGLAAGTDA